MFNNVINVNTQPVTSIEFGKANKTFILRPSVDTTVNISMDFEFSAENEVIKSTILILPTVIGDTEVEFVLPNDWKTPPDNPLTFDGSKAWAIEFTMVNSLSPDSDEKTKFVLTSRSTAHLVDDEYTLPAMIPPTPTPTPTPSGGGKK